MILSFQKYPFNIFYNKKIKISLILTAFLVHDETDTMLYFVTISVQSRLQI